MNFRFIKTAEYMSKGELDIFQSTLNIIKQEGFPCIFAQRVANNMSAFAIFVSDINQYNEFLNGVTEYTEFIKQNDPLVRILNPLIVFIDDNSSSLKEQHDKAWFLIQTLIDNNPSEVPINYHDTTNPQWCLLFNDIQLFVNISASEYSLLKSRNIGKGIHLIINPREIFDVVAPYNKPKGLKIRNKIRERIVSFNKQPLPAELGFYGDENNFEWRQYQLYEFGGKDNTKYPLNFKRKSTANYK